MGLKLAQFYSHPNTATLHTNVTVSSAGMLYKLSRCAIMGTPPCAGAYRINAWHCIDTFVYFSHHLVTIPPPGWMDAAHTNGVPVRTLLIEGGALSKHHLSDCHHINGLRKPLIVHILEMKWIYICIYIHIYLGFILQAHT